MMKMFTQQEVARHNKPGDLWIIVNNKVYDLTRFAKMHPGGDGILLTVAGKDATNEFNELHRQSVLRTYEKFVIGTVEGITPPKPQPLFSEIPYGEVNWLQGFRSKYYTDHHKQFLRACRTFYESLRPGLEACELSGRHPKKYYKSMGDQGIWALQMGIGPWMKGRKVFGFDGEKLDYFHEKITHEEFGRLCMAGACDGIQSGNLIGTPPILKFGRPEVQYVVERIFAGTHNTVLAITEPYAGSDVANIRTTAVKTPCGKYYIVNGIKKWITNGTFSDYFTTAVRTGGKGMRGISMLLIERGPGITTKKMKTSYSPAAGTALICYDNVKVPVEHLLGKENQGFRVIMTNFNHERWMISTGVCRSVRTVVEECIKWSNQRKVFGKNLLSQPVIRNKLGQMISRLESLESYMDNITDQMCWMNEKQ
eukprot:UN24877